MANAFELAEPYLGQFLDFDGVYGSQCLTGEYLVKFIDGSYKQVKDVEMGEILSTRNVVISNKAKVDTDIYWLRLSQGWFKVTKDHKIFCKDGYKKVTDLVKGKDEILLDLNENKKSRFDLTDDEFRLFGFWLGDGSASYRYETSRIPQVRITVGTKEKEEYLEGLSIYLNKRMHSNGRAKEFSLINKAHYELADLIHRFKDKKIDDVFTKREYSLIIEGYLKADGTIKNNSYVATSVNKQLLVTLQHGCHINGWSCVLGKRMDRDKTNYFDNPKPLWRITVNKKRKLVNKFISLEYIGKDTVYLLNTTGDHSYYADNQMHHNCVDIIGAVSSKLGFQLFGNGNQIGTVGNVQAHADVLPWQEGMELRTGDIISQEVIGHGYGHVVIFGSGTYDDALVIEQNFNAGPVVKHRRSLRPQPPLRVVRFRNQSNYNPEGGNKSDGTSGGNATGTNQPQEKKPLPSDGVLYEVTCDIVEAVDNVGSTTKVDTFYKCNKLVGKENGDYLVYKRYDSSVAFIPLGCVKKVNPEKKDNEIEKFYNLNKTEKYPDKTRDGLSQHGINTVYTLSDLVKNSKISYNNREWGYLFSNNVPNEGADIKGKRLNHFGFLVDGDGYIVLAYPEKLGDIKGTVYKTPFGYAGKAYYSSNDIDEMRVYIK